jgi:DNA-binding response OmpR family regulator
MASPSRIVGVVEKEDTLRESIHRALGAEGLRAQAFADGAAAAEAFRGKAPDLAILGSDAPTTGGFDLCRQLRARVPSLPIIVVTPRAEEIDQALANELRADDYLSKPFSIRELMVRVTALLRRAALTGNEPLAWEDRPLALGPLTADPLRLTAHWGGRDVGLTVTEFFILRALVSRAGVVKTRDQLTQEAYPAHGSGDRAIDGHIVRIRQKFEAVEPGFDAIEGVHGAGYRYRSGASSKRA